MSVSLLIGKNFSELGKALIRSRDRSVTKSCSDRKPVKQDCTCFVVEWYLKNLLYFRQLGEGSGTFFKLFKSKISITYLAYQVQLVKLYDVLTLKCKTKKGYLTSQILNGFQNKKI